VRAEVGIDGRCQGEANNLAEYVKDLLDRRGDDDVQITISRLRRRARDVERKLADTQAKLAEALRLAAEKDKEVKKKDEDVAYWKGKFGPVSGFGEKLLRVCIA
jgi:hypothetical protein